MALNDTLQSIVNKDYDELLGMAKLAIGDVLPYCKKIDEKNDGMLILTTILMAAVASDGKLTALESKFIGDLTGLSEDKIYSLACVEPAKTAALVDSFADALSVEAKASICVLVSTIFACDTRISVEENQYLQKILA